MSVIVRNTAETQAAVNENGRQTEALLEAGFSSVEVLKNWGATYTIKAVR